jgi:hypothetical protein
VTRGLLAAGALFLLVGCSAPVVSAQDLPEPAPAAVDVVAVPTAIDIPKLGAHSTLEQLGLDPATGELLAPPIDEPMQAGFYGGPDPVFIGDEVLPGELGPAVVAAHVDGVIDGRKGQPGLFHQLHTLQPGDEVLIERQDAPTLRFAVYAVELHTKAEFPTGRVYGDTDRPELRLVTCGGPFDRGSGHYTDNWIVWAALV